MKELDTIELQLIDQARKVENLENLSKVAEILRNIAERKKLLAESEKARFEASDAAAGSSFQKTRFWATTLTPLLAVFLTAATFGLSFFFQIQQSKKTATDEEDSQWRSAIEKAYFSKSASRSGAVLEMQSFLTSPRYRAGARSVASTLLPEVEDTGVFDLVFFDLLSRTNEENQDEMVDLVRAISNRLWDVHQKAILESSVRGLRDSSFTSFLRRPDSFFDADDPRLREALAATWKLDSVSRGLADLWRQSVHTTGPSPRGQDLSGIAFLNGDFTNVSFKGASINDTSFVGKCKVNRQDFDEAQLSSVRIECGD